MAGLHHCTCDNLFSNLRYGQHTELSSMELAASGIPSTTVVATCDQAHL